MHHHGAAESHLPGLDPRGRQGPGAARRGGQATADATPTRGRRARWRRGRLSPGPPARPRHGQDRGGLGLPDAPDGSRSLGSG